MTITVKERPVCIIQSKERNFASTKGESGYPQFNFSKIIGKKMYVRNTGCNRV